MEGEQHLGKRLLVIAFVFLYNIAAVSAGPLNVTIYDSHPHQVGYYPESICVDDSGWFSRLFCWNYFRPWQRVYWNGGQTGSLATMHQSINHHLVEMSVDFFGSAIWIYSCPRKDLQAPLVDYKICVHTSLNENSECFRVNVTEAYLDAADDYTPVPIFAMGNLLQDDHRIMISLADPTDGLSSLSGITFTHAVYTVDRPTPWPLIEDSWRFRSIALHDTHPQIRFVPEPFSTFCDSQFLGFCTHYSVAWISNAFTTLDGSIASYHLLDIPKSSNLPPLTATATFKAGSVALYGLPKSMINSDSRLVSLCVRINDGPCEYVDVEHAYLNAIWDDSTLLWHNHALDPLRDTHLAIHVTASSRIFGFVRIEYKEEKEYSSAFPWGATYRNVSVDHSHGDAIYHPGKRCSRKFLFWCTRWFEAWSWQTVGPQSALRSYRSTFAGYLENEDPFVSFSFRGSAVYVYGAPRQAMSQSKAHQRFCLDQKCTEIDLTHAYLNAPPVFNALASVANITETNIVQEYPVLSGDTVQADGWVDPELEPVLLYYVDGLDDELTHTVELRLAVASDPYYAQMTISKIVYTEVTYDPGHPRPPLPAPAPYPAPPPSFPAHAVRWVPSITPPLPPPSGYLYANWAILLFLFLSIVRYRVIPVFLTLREKSDVALYTDTVPNYSAIPRSPSRGRLSSPPPPYRP